MSAGINISAGQNTFLKRYYTPGSDSKIVLMQDKSLILFGKEQTTFLGVAHFDSIGNPLLGKKIDLNYVFDIKKIRQDVNGNWILLLGNNSLVKLDSSFNILWSKTYTDAANQLNILFSDFVMMSNDSSYYITGTTDVGFINPNSSLLLLKINNNGAVQWAKYFDALNTWYPIPLPTYETGLSIQKLNDGNLLIGGNSGNDTLTSSYEISQS